MVILDALNLSPEAREAVAELSAACDWTFNSLVTVVRQSTQVPNTSKSSARGGVFRAMAIPAINFRGESSGVDSWRSYYSNMKLARSAMEGSDLSDGSENRGKRNDAKKRRPDGCDHS